MVAQHCAARGCQANEIADGGASCKSDRGFARQIEALGDVGEALKQVASAVFGGDFSHTLPVFYKAKLAERGPTPTDEFAGLDTLGQAELFKVWIKFLDP